ncbi:MAG: MFS transporter [Syntrophobacterales bacterium]|nr:MFS transporter [Syntrophobacterales bacterium]
MKNLNVYLRYNVVILTALGFSSGLPLALTGSTLQAWLFSEGVNLGTIGLFSLVGLPYSVKIMWAPIIDYYVIPFLGRRRGWIFSTQCGLVVFIAILGLLAWFMESGGFPFRHSKGLLVIAALIVFSIAFLSATQDIAIDAYRTDILAPEERGAGAATTVLGYRIAMLTSGAFALVLSDYVSWNLVFWILAIIMSLCIIATFFSKEPHSPSRLPKNLKEAILNPMVEYFSRPDALRILLFIIFFKLGDVMAGAMSTPFLLDIGFSRSDVGMVNKVFGLTSTILGTFAGGTVIARIGLNRSLWVFGVLQIISNFSFVGLASFGKVYPLMVAAVGIENFTGGMGTAGFVAFLMSLCRKEHSATQYAFFSSLMAITRVIASAPTGIVAEKFGWVIYYVLTIIGSLPGLALLVMCIPWNDIKASQSLADTRI